MRAGEKRVAARLLSNQESSLDFRFRCLETSHFLKAPSFREVQPRDRGKIGNGFPRSETFGVVIECVFKAPAPEAREPHPVLDHRERRKIFFLSSGIAR